MEFDITQSEIIYSALAAYWLELDKRKKKEPEGGPLFNWYVKHMADVDKIAAEIWSVWQKEDWPGWLWNSPERISGPHFERK